jgi:hypothetical protein
MQFAAADDSPCDVHAEAKKMRIVSFLGCTPGRRALRGRTAALLLIVACALLVVACALLVVACALLVVACALSAATAFGADEQSGGPSSSGFAVRMRRSITFRGTARWKSICRLAAWRTCSFG